MPQIDDIRINGQQTTTTPTIAGLHPVISWDFDENVAAPSQASYHLRIGTNSIDHGTSEFSGNIINVEVASSANFYEHIEHSLERSRTYYGQIRVSDPDGDISPWKKFTFNTNSLPFVTNFVLSPIFPTVSDDIELSYQYNDIDGHDQAGTKIRWFKNNILVPEYNDLCILPSKATAIDESWTVKIIPSDGLEFGPIAETSAVTIQDIETTFNKIDIFPLDANVDDILKVEFETIEDEYISLADSSVTYEWYVNDVAVKNSNSQFIRMDLNPGDIVQVALTLTQSDGTSIAQASSDPITIQDVEWHISNLTANGLSQSVNLTDLTPILEWKVEKSTVEKNILPLFIRIMITKTLARSGAIYDSGVFQYTKNSFVIPENILSRGQNYFVHVGVSDTTPIPEDNFVHLEININGSSWSELVDNNKGWTIETKLELKENSLIDPLTNTVPEIEEGKEIPLPRMGLHIHDGTYFCSITFGQKEIKFHSNETLTYDIPTDISDLRSAKTFKISGKDKNAKVFMDNKLIIDASGLLTNLSKLKQLEYGDIDGKYINDGTFKFFRYTTSGASGIDNSLANENTFHFHKIGTIEGGTIEHVMDNLISWTPDNESESSRLIQFNENSVTIQLPTATKNFSPITSIFIDKDRNKYIGTANGINAIFGEKHAPDYQFLTSDSDVVITSEDFDRITSLNISDIALVEPDTKSGWFTLDTTFRSIGTTDTNVKFLTGDPYDPYTFGIKSHAIHYYTQRTHGHAWYDLVDNKKGWQVEFSFQLDKLEQDVFKEQNIDHQGFGVFLNDGTYQEILYFYPDRIRLFHANVYVPIVTTIPRNYRIVAKDKNLFIYQKIDNPAITSYQLLVDASGLFTTPATAAGNSRHPKMTFDSGGLYHTVWHDDGNARSQIFYSSYDGSTWSNPEIIAQSKFALRNPVLEVDSSGRIWVAYEDSSWGQTEISVSVKDSAGWNTSTRITNYRSNKANPAIMIDIFDNIHLVWEDDRNGPYQIFWAQRKFDIQAWLSSGQFGNDIAVMQQHDINDPYSDGAVQFHNPDLAYVHPNLWLVAQADKQDHSSVIYRSSRNVDNEVWQSMGTPIFDSDGDFIGSGISTLTSTPGRNSVKPSLAANESLSQLVVVWEDQTEPVSQIWGSSFNSSGVELEAPIQITGRVSNCTDPAVGFVNNKAAILFQTDGDIYLASYDSGTTSFQGSRIEGSSDTLIQVSPNQTYGNPALAKYVPAQNFRMTYDFLRDQDSTLEALEFPNYYLIGDAVIEHGSTTSTISEGMISNIDTKEFAFGDMSENISILAHWKDIKFYFGYDARPYLVGKFNSSTVLNWPDNRINDLFVDVFGNIIAATFKGLVYYNVFSGELNKIEGIGEEPLVTAIKWGGNGAWYVGTTDGLFLSTSAGKEWQQYSGVPGVNAIAIDQKGRAICGTTGGVVIANPDGNFEIIPIASNLPQVADITDFVRAIAVDENDIIWCGTDRGLIRIENKDIFMLFNRQSGLRSSYITDIAIVNKYLRYIATANGVDRMNGTNFSSISTRTHNLLNNNIARIMWDKSTNSLWIASLHALHEIVFKDPYHEIISDETVQYDSSELLTTQSFDSRVYDILDTEEIQTSHDDLEITPESSTVLINKNPIDFGYTISEFGRSITFATDLLVDDEVEIKISNKFIEFHNFNQSNIEKKVIGDKRTIIKKMAKTFTKNQRLFLSGGDNHKILFFAGQSNLPFTTVLLDRDLPQGCFKKLDTLTKTTLTFKILAYDIHSGIDGYMLSNFENFTSDGESPLSFSSLPTDGIVSHDIGSGINNVTTSFTFPTSVKIGQEIISINNGGSNFGIWTDIDNNKTFLYATTSFPPIVWRLDPETNIWTAVSRLDISNTRQVTDMLEFNNVLFIATGDASGSGVVYKTTDGVNFDVASITTLSSHFNSIAVSLDGTLYFGDGSGNIYDYKFGASTMKYSGIGDSINSLAIWKDTLVAGTGNRGRIYTINLQTGDNLIIFTGNETDINEVYIKDSFTTSSVEDTKVYAGSGDLTTIYRGNLDTFDFIKSFSSFGKTIRRIRSIDGFVLDPEDTSGETKVVAIVGDSLFKHKQPAWEFLYLHDNQIQDFIQYGNPGSEGIYIITDTGIVKWTNELTQKTVYLRLRDKAGNISPTPVLDPKCPANEDDFCCTHAYSINIADLKNFINDSRIVNIDEYGVVQFTYDSPNDRSFYSADEIDQEIGIYTSEIFNGSNDLVSWKTITWETTEPVGTTVGVQIRSGVTEDDVKNAEWSSDLIKSGSGNVSIEHITNQYIQFRAILTSNIRDLSPTLTSITIRNLTTQSSHFFTTNFVLPSRPIKGILSANTFIPVSADVVFGINTKNSVDFGDYQIIEPNRVFTSAQGQFGKNFRIGAKLLSPGLPQLDTADQNDPYDISTFVCTVSFVYQNIDSISKDFHFRIKFFNDPLRSQLIHTFYSGNDQTGWSFGTENNNFPAKGITIASNNSKTISFAPADSVETNQRWYVTIESYDGSNFETVIDDRSYVCSSCNITNVSELISEYYKTGLPETLDAIPAFSSFVPDYSLTEDNLSFPSNFGEWKTTKNVTLSGYINNFAARFRGKIQAPSTGVYIFELQSNDGSRLFINANEIIDHDGIHSYTTASGEITLTEGFHDIEVQYFDGTGEARLELRWILPGETTAVVIPKQRFFHAIASEYCVESVTPQISNFAVLFEMEDGETVKLNLTP